MSNPIVESYLNSDTFGKSIFIALFALSTITWILLLHKVWVVKSARRLSPKALSFVENQDTDPLDLECEELGSKSIPNPFIDILNSLKTHTLAILDKNQIVESKVDSDNSKQPYLLPPDIDLVDAHLQMVKNQHLEYLERNLFVLSMVVGLAPFLGLLGTVWGVLLTLGELQLHGNATISDQMLSGLSMALATTVLGLVVAIPAMISFSYLKNRIYQFSLELDDYSHILLARIEMYHRIS
jgi:biopolymer transport protein TolQ